MTPDALDYNPALKYDIDRDRKRRRIHAPSMSSELGVLDAALRGCSGMGVVTCAGVVYAHLVNHGDGILVDITNGGLVIWGRDYDHIIQAAIAEHTTSAVSLVALGLIGEASPVAIAVHEVLTSVPESDEEPVLPFMPTDTSPLPTAPACEPEPLMDIPERAQTPPEPRVIDESTIGPVPSYYERVQLEEAPEFLAGESK
jgi:hypothetical protein